MNTKFTNTKPTITSIPSLDEIHDEEEENKDFSTSQNLQRQRDKLLGT